MWGGANHFLTREKWVGEGKVVYVILINKSVECEIVASIKQLIWRLYFILMIRFFLCDRSVLSVSWGFTRQKVQLFLQRFKPGTKFFLKTRMRVVNLPN